MKTSRHNSEHAFTMIEIAICLAVIGFALVAIIGILPSGLQVQRDNREDTIINQDGTYWLEAIRSGATDLDDLVDYVTNITFVEFDYRDTNEPPALRFTTNPCRFSTGRRIIGSLSTPYNAQSVPDCVTPDPDFRVYRVEATVRSISGNAMEKGPDNPTITFEYLLQAQVLPAGPFLINTNQVAISNLQSNLHDVRLTFRWPVLPGGKIGNNKKVFRTMISGALTNSVEGYFFTRDIYFVP